MSVKTCTSVLRCEDCGSKMPIARKRGNRRESGHVKHMWCFKCKTITAHMENDRNYL